jgi:hypothetical protein
MSPKMLIGNVLDGNANDVEREQWFCAHRIQVRQCVRRGDLAERIGVVDQGREEIERLHQSGVALQCEDRGIIGRRRADQNARISNLRKLSQDLRQVFRVQLARSPSAVTQSGESDRFQEFDLHRGPNTPRPSSRPIVMEASFPGNQALAPGSVDARPHRDYAAGMRLSDRKIESLAEKMLRWLESQADVQLLAPRDEVLEAIVGEFQAEKELERLLDDEVDRILQLNEARMRLEGIDPWVMRRKVRAAVGPRARFDYLIRRSEQP